MFVAYKVRFYGRLQYRRRDKRLLLDLVTYEMVFQIGLYCDRELVAQVPRKGTSSIIKIISDQIMTNDGERSWQVVCRVVNVQ